MIRKAMDTNIAKHFAFVESADARSFTKAAQKLSYSQSAVSRMISDLEKEWGITLLKRNRGGIELTSDGEQMLPLCRTLCKAYENILLQAESLKGLVTGKIKIATFSSIATHRLPKLVAEFHNEYPGIEFEFMLGNYSEIERWVMSGRADCGFTRSPCNKGLHAIPFERDQQMVVLPKNHPLSEMKAIPTEKLADHPFLALEQEGDSDIEAIFAAANIEPNVVLTTWDDYAILAFVEQGFGVSILPSLILERLSFEVKINPLKNPVYREIMFITKRDSHESNALSHFISCLQKFREQSGFAKERPIPSGLPSNDAHGRWVRE